MTPVVDLTVMAAAALVKINATLPEPVHLWHAHRIEAAAFHVADQRPAAYLNQILEAVRDAAGACPCTQCKSSEGASR